MERQLIPDTFRSSRILTTAELGDNRTSCSTQPLSPSARGGARLRETPFRALAPCLPWDWPTGPHRRENLHGLEALAHDMSNSIERCLSRLRPHCAMYQPP